MPRLKNSSPKLCHDKNSGQGVVRLDNKKFYLGKFGTPECQTNYDRILSEWLNNGRTLQTDSNRPTSVNDLIVRFWDHATGWYVKDGKPTSEQHCYKMALRPFRDLYGPCRIEDFGPLALDAVRSAMISKGWTRNTINLAVCRLRHIFKWGVSQQIVPVTVYEALRTLAPLVAGRTLAPEGKPRDEVSDDDIDAVKKSVRMQRTRDLIDLQVLTGARPGELLGLATSDVDCSDDVWVAHLERHKNAHRGKERFLVFGPRAQDLLSKYLLPDSPDDLIFGGFTVNGYRTAVVRACERLGITHWSPHWLRHAAATRIQRQHGLLQSKAVLGHADVNTTQLYSHADLDVAKKLLREIG